MDNCLACVRCRQQGLEGTIVPRQHGVLEGALDQEAGGALVGSSANRGSVTSLATSLLLTRKGGTLSPLWGQVAGTGPVCEFFLLGPRGQLPGLLPDTPLIPP